MTVRLIAVTRPVVPEIPGTKEIVPYCARVSNPANQTNHDTAEKLLGYLERNQHWSPFEMAHATVEIVTTRDIARQILRHRSFAFQEFSQRYAAVVGMASPRECRMQDAKNRQNSFEADNAELEDWWETAQRNLVGLATATYADALANGVAKEVARSVLPEGLTSSTLLVAGSVRSWVHYVRLRSGNGTQKEHRAIALACAEALRVEFGDVFDLPEA